MALLSKHQLFSTRHRLPDMHLSGGHLAAPFFDAVGHSQPGAVRTERQAANVAPMSSGERANQAARSGLPQFGRSVRANGTYRLAVGAEVDAAALNDLGIELLQ